MTRHPLVKIVAALIAAVLFQSCVQPDSEVGPTPVEPTGYSPLSCSSVHGKILDRLNAGARVSAAYVGFFDLPPASVLLGQADFTRSNVNAVLDVAFTSKDLRFSGTARVVFGEWFGGVSGSESNSLTGSYWYATISCGYHYDKSAYIVEFHADGLPTITAGLTIYGVPRP